MSLNSYNIAFSHNELSENACTKKKDMHHRHIFFYQTERVRLRRYFSHCLVNKPRQKVCFYKIVLGHVW